jgi:CRP-like cAMP-binding protein
MAHFVAPNCHTCSSRHNSLLDCCHSAELDLISLGKQCQVYQRGQVIFHEDGRAGGLYCIHQGLIKLAKVGGDGKEHILRLVKGGDVMGFRALLSNGYYSASAVALDESIVCFVPKADFLHVVETNARMSTSLMRMLAEALGEAEERMLHLAYKPVRERLAEALLLLLLLRACQKGDSVEQTDIFISREDLASLVGTAKETAIRLLSEMKNEGLLTTKGSHITILKADRLTDIASLYD